MTLPPPPDRSRFRRLDGARGVAVLMVAAFHCFGMTFERFELPWAANGLAVTIVPTDASPVPLTYLAMFPFTMGWAGVAVFFVLSGFLIHHAELRAARPFSPARFAWRRAWRILPPYLLPVVVFTLLTGAGTAQLLTHIALVHNVWPATYWGLNPSFWSLGVEAQFYALYPLLLWVRRRTSPAGPLALAFTVSAAASAVLAWHADWRGAEATSKFVWWNTLPLWFSWAIGMFLADRFSAGVRVFGRPLVWGSALAVASGAATLAKPTWPASFTLAAGAAAAAIEACLWSPRGDWLGQRWIVGVGLCSYSIYLWHQKLLPPVVLAVGRLPLPALARFPLGMAAATLVIGPVAMISYALVERPSQRVGQRFGKR